MSKVDLFVGTEKGLFILSSDAHRDNWTVKGPLLKGWRILNVSVDLRLKPVLYAAVGHYVYGACIQKSEDWGKTWRQIENGPGYAEHGTTRLNNIWNIVPSTEAHPGVLYAGVDEAGLFVSRDHGEHWEELSGLSGHESRAEWVAGAGGLCCHSIVVSEDDPNQLWVGISAVGVFRSDDGGARWQLKNDGLEIVILSQNKHKIGSCVHRLVQDPGNPRRLFQQNHKGVFRSFDAGDNWERIENGLPGTFGFPMVINRNQPDMLFVIPQESDEFRIFPEGRLTVYRTDDAGDSWVPMRKGLPDNCFSGVLRHGMDSDGISGRLGVYFGTTSGQLYCSRDAGEEWRQMPGVYPRIASVTALTVQGG